MIYKLVNENKKSGFKGKRLTNENINGYPDRIKALWQKAGIIKEVKQPNTKKE